MLKMLEILQLQQTDFYHISRFLCTISSKSGKSSTGKDRFYGMMLRCGWAQSLAPLRKS